MLPSPDTAVTAPGTEGGPVAPDPRSAELAAHYFSCFSKAFGS